MDWIEITGHVASAFSSITFMPQVYKSWKTKSVNDLSFATLYIVFSSTVIWLVYGIGKGLWPVIVCNSVICFLSIILIYFKLTFPKTSS